MSEQQGITGLTPSNDAEGGATALRTGPSGWRGDAIGWGPTRARWYSFCSWHRGYADDCPACDAGQYINDWKHAADSLVYRRAYGVWFWWHNRPTSASRRLLEKHFPGLRPSASESSPSAERGPKAS